MPATDPMLGASGYERIAGDAYMTPVWVWEALVAKVALRGPVWECAAGTGNGVVALREAGFTVIPSDIDGKGATTPVIPLDFLAYRPCDKLIFSDARTIATNPPYSLQDQFIERALDLMRPVGGMVCMLLNHQTDTAKSRRRFFADCAAFAGKLVLTKRIDWMGGAGARQNDAWYVFDFSYQTRFSNASIGYAP